MSVDSDLGQATADEPTADNPDAFIRVAVADGWGVVQHIKRTRGVAIAERAVTDALRRKRLKFHQVGQVRYVTPRQIDAWLDSCIVPPQGH